MAADLPYIDSRHRPTEVLIVTDTDSCFAGAAQKLRGPDASLRRCRTAGECLVEARAEPPAVVLIECSGQLMLGLQLCRSLREMPELHASTIIIWAAGIGPGERLACYEAGCDDALRDAQLTEEAVLRIRAATRRAALRLAAPATLRHASLELDPDGFRASMGGRVVRLSVGQTRLLRLFMEHPGRVFSRAELAAAIWPEKPVDGEAVKTAVVRLRQALLKAGGASPIRNVKGEGYSLDLEAGQPDRPQAAEL